MYGTRQQRGKANATSSNRHQPHRSPQPRPQNRSQKHPTRSKSPEDNEPKYRVRNSPPNRGEELLELTEHTGDIFNAPPNTLIIHACNCDGSWGAGIAAAFKHHYPQAYEAYAEHCNAHAGELLESALLIPPVDASPSDAGETPDDALQFSIPSKAKSQRTAKHFVGCLFTSRHYGRRRDSPGRILAATAPAMVDLLRKVNAWNAEAGEGEGEEIREVRMCRINSGLFGVEWARTRAVLGAIEVGRSGVKRVEVFSPAER